MNGSSKTWGSLQRELEELERSNPEVARAAKRYDETVKEILSKPRGKVDLMTSTQVYDLLIQAGLVAPAVVQLGDRYVLGSWEEIGELREGTILKSGRFAVVVLGEGATLTEALGAARAAHPDLLWP